MKRLSFGILIFGLGVCFSDAVTLPSPSPGPVRFAIKAGRLLDVRTGSVTENVFISVEGDRIVNVSSSAPSDVKVIDLSNRFVMPGMVDCHAHVLGNLKDDSPGAALRMSSPKRALWGARNLRGWLDKGFYGVALRRRGRPSVRADRVARWD